MNQAAYQSALRESWLLGDAAVARIIILQESLYGRAIQAASSLLQGPIVDYSPWMSGGFERDIPWPNLPKVGMGTPACPIVLDAEQLKQAQLALDHGLKLGMGSESTWVEICVDVLSLEPTAGSLFHEAWDLLVSSKSFLGNLLESVVVQIIPIQSTEVGLWSGVSSSSQKAIGAIFVGLPRRSSPFPVLDLAISLAHELGHQVLMIYQRSDRILSSSLEAPSFSGTRGTSRPAIRAVHAACALAYMAEGCRILRESAQLQQEAIAYLIKREHGYRQALGATTKGLRIHSFTPFGSQLLAELANHAITD